MTDQETNAELLARLEAAARQATTALTDDAAGVLADFRRQDGPATRNNRH